MLNAPLPPFDFSGELLFGLSAVNVGVIVFLLSLSAINKVVPASESVALPITSLKVISLVSLFASWNRFTCFFIGKYRSAAVCYRAGYHCCTRLVRRICDDCRVPVQIEKATLHKLGAHFSMEDTKHFKGRAAENVIIPCIREGLRFMRYWFRMIK